MTHVITVASSKGGVGKTTVCLLYTSDAADERSSVDLGGRRIIKKKKTGAEVERWGSYYNKY